MYIDRKELIQEERLRLLIRKSIKTVNRKKMLEEQKEKEEQQKLRSYIIKLVEAEKNLAAPHPSTGINVLEDLLKKIIPQIEAEYKKLTTSHEQRASFQTHIVNAIQNSLAPTMASEKAGTAAEEEKAIDIDLYESPDMKTAFAKSGGVGSTQAKKDLAWQQEVDRLNVGEAFYVAATPRGGKVTTIHIQREAEDMYLISKPTLKMVQNLKAEEVYNLVGDGASFEVMDVGRSDRVVEEVSQLKEAGEIEMEVGDEVSADVEDNNEFIDIDGGADSDPAAEKEDAFSVKGEDETGRNMAFKAFERVETSIIDAYAILSNDEDRELFYDYLLTNMKLYFDKFEDELTSILPEPTTPEYEAEKDQQDFNDEEGEAAIDDLGGEEGLDDLAF